LKGSFGKYSMFLAWKGLFHGYTRLLGVLRTVSKVDRALLRETENVFSVNRALSWAHGTLGSIKGCFEGR